MNPLDWMNPWAQPTQDPWMLPSPGASVFRSPTRSTEHLKGDQLPFNPNPNAIPGQPMIMAGAQPSMAGNEPGSRGPSELPAPSNYGPDQDPQVASVLTDGLSAEQSNAMVQGTEDPQIEPAGGPVDTTGNMDAPTQNSENAPDEAYNSKAKDSIDLGSPSWGKFMSNPGSSDALLAFGAQMLSAKSFNEGLGKGGAAFGAALKPYERMSNAEKERLDYAARLKQKVVAAGKSGSVGKWIKGPDYIDGDNKLHQRWKNNVTGEEQDNLINGIPPDQAGIGAQAKADVKSLQDYRQTATKAIGNENIAEQLIKLRGSIGAGQGLWQTGLRAVSGYMGMDIGNVDLSDAQVFKKLSAQLELQLAQSQKGLGQFTEMERQIVRDALPNVSTEEVTILQVATRLKLDSQMHQEIMNGWDEMSASDRKQVGGWQAYEYKARQKGYKTYKSRYEKLIQGAIEAEAVQPDGSTIPGDTQGRRPLGEIFTTN